MGQKPKPKDVVELIIEANSLKRDILALQREFKFNVGQFPFTVQGFYDWLRDGVGTYAWDLSELRRYHQSIREAAEKARAMPVPDCKLGEWYILGEHFLYCGDTSEDKFWVNLPKVSFAFADPPYNAGVDEWDNNFNWDHDWLAAKADIVAVTPGISSIFDFGLITEMQYHWSMACHIINGRARGALGFGNWIYVALFSKYESIHRNAQDFFKITLIPTEKARTDHRGRKPSAFMREMIGRFTERGDKIIDPFLGSGTTLLEADKLDRICISGEINPKFCNEIIAHWQGQTGRVAKRLENGYQG